MWNARLDESQAGMKTVRRNINSLYTDTTLKVENKLTKETLMGVKEDSEEAGLKVNIQKTKIMASGPITSWQILIEGEKVTDFIFLGFRVTVDGDCSHEIKSDLLLERKAMTNLDSILESQHITMPMKVYLVWFFQ